MALASTALKIGISEPVNTVLAIWMADAAGRYEANGLKIEIVNMSGGSRGAAALAAGEIDAMHVGLSSVVRLNRTGGELRVIAALANVIRFTFFAAPGVRTAADLKGGVVGVSIFGSESDVIVGPALQRLGLTRNDVVLKEYGGSAGRLAAVISGEIQATALNEPVASMARDQGVHVLVDFVPERVPWLFTAIVTTRGAIESKRDVLTRFIRATAEGNALALTDEKRAKAVLADKAAIRDPKILDVSYNDFKQLSPPDLTPTRAAADNILAQFPDANSNLDDYIDMRILDSLRNDGALAASQHKRADRTA
jgi:ABC-type nitrate/sulfonate/bicarbonate transport system substrate-binding protein